MESLTQTHSFLITNRGLRYTICRARSRPEASLIVQDLSSHRALLRSSWDTYEDAHEERIAATAEIEYRDGLVNACVMTVARHVHAVVDGNTRDPRYVKIFSEAPSDALKPVGGTTKAEFIRGVVHVLETDEAFEALRPHAAIIERAQAEFDESVRRRSECQVIENTAWSAFQIELDAARDAYNRSQHHFALLFPKDKALVESFYRPHGTRTREATEETEGEAPATPMKALPDPSTRGNSVAPASPAKPRTRTAVARRRRR
jgi:hypothetical protein